MQLELVGTTHRDLISFYSAPILAALHGRYCTVKQSQLQACVTHYKALVRHAFLNQATCTVVDIVHYAAKDLSRAMSAWSRDGEAGVCLLLPTASHHSTRLLTLAGLATRCYCPI